VPVTQSCTSRYKTLQCPCILDHNGRENQTTYEDDECNESKPRKSSPQVEEDKIKPDQQVERNRSKPKKSRLVQCTDGGIESKPRGHTRENASHPRSSAALSFVSEVEFEDPEKRSRTPGPGKTGKTERRPSNAHVYSISMDERIKQLMKMMKVMKASQENILEKMQTSQDRQLDDIKKNQGPRKKSGLCD